MSINSNIKLKVLFLLLITLPLHGHTTILTCEISSPNDRSLFVTFPALGVAYEIHDSRGKHAMNFFVMGDSQKWIPVWTEFPLDSTMGPVEVKLPATLSGPRNPLRADINAAKLLIFEKKNLLDDLNPENLLISIISAAGDFPSLPPTTNLIDYSISEPQSLQQTLPTRTLEQSLSRLRPHSKSYRLQLVNPQFISLWAYIAKQMTDVGTDSNQTDRLQKALAKLLFWQGQPNIPYLFQSFIVQPRPQLHISVANNPGIAEVTVSENELTFSFTQDLIIPSEFFSSLTPTPATSSQIRLLRPRLSPSVVACNTYCCACVIFTVFLTCLLVKAGTSL